MPCAGKGCGMCRRSLDRGPASIVLKLSCCRRCHGRRGCPVKADMQRQWQQVRQQWRDNARLRVLAAVVVAILLFSFLQHLHQLQSEAKQDALRQWQRLQDVTQLSRESHWQEYAEQSEGEMEQLHARLWHAESEGQAQAQLRDKDALGAVPVPKRVFGTLKVRARLRRSSGTCCSRCSASMA